MRRDYAVMRKLLMAHEASPMSLMEVDVEGVGPEIANHHARLLEEAGWVEWAALQHGGPTLVGPMTLAGHDAVDAMRDKRRFLRAMEETNDGRVPWEVFHDVLMEPAP